MRRWKRLFYYLIINILVSACTVLVVLNVWARTHPQGSQDQETITPAALNATPGIFSTGALGTGGEPENPETVENTPEPDPADIQEPEPESAVTEYRVQPGDTLGAIAVRFNISVNDLLEANDLTDPDRLEVGQTLTIPDSEEAPPVDQAPTEEEEIEPVEPSATPRPPEGTSPAVTGEAKVVIDGVVGAGDLDAERVLLKRTGAGELSLAGWQLSAGDGPVFTFPQLTLFEGGSVDLYTQSGQGTAVKQYWGLDKSIWSSGMEILLLDDQGKVQATYQVP